MGSRSRSRTRLKTRRSKSMSEQAPVQGATALLCRTHTFPSFKALDGSLDGKSPTQQPLPLQQKEPSPFTEAIIAHERPACMMNAEAPATTTSSFKYFRLNKLLPLSFHFNLPPSCPVRTISDLNPSNHSIKSN